MVLSWLEKLIWVKIISISNILTTSVWNSALNLVVIAVHFLFNNLSHLYRNLSVQICCYSVICFTRMRERVSESRNKDVKPTLLKWCGTLLISVLYKFALVHKIVNSRTVCRYFFNIVSSCIPQSGSMQLSSFSVWLLAPSRPLTSGAPCLWLHGRWRAESPPAPSGLHMAEIQGTGLYSLTRDAPGETAIPVQNGCVNQKTVGGICCTSCRLVLNCAVAFFPLIPGDNLDCMK